MVQRAHQIRRQKMNDNSPPFSSNGYIYIVFGCFLIIIVSCSFFDCFWNQKKGNWFHLEVNGTLIVGELFCLLFDWHLTDACSITTKMMGNVIGTESVPVIWCHRWQNLSSSHSNKIPPRNGYRKSNGKYEISVESWNERECGCIDTFDIPKC